MTPHALLLVACTQICDSYDAKPLQFIANNHRMTMCVCIDWEGSFLVSEGEPYDTGCEIYSYVNDNSFRD